MQHSRSFWVPSSLYAVPEFPGLGSVLPYRSRDVGFTDFDE